MKHDGARKDSVMWIHEMKWKRGKRLFMSLLALTWYLLGFWRNDLICSDKNECFKTLSHVGQGKV